MQSSFVKTWQTKTATNTREGGMIIKYLEEAMRDLKHAFRSSTKKEIKYFE